MALISAWQPLLSWQLFKTRQQVKETENLRDLKTFPPLGLLSFMNIYTIDLTNSFILKR
jgi:hypothetical protein